MKSVGFHLTSYLANPCQSSTFFFSETMPHATYTLIAPIVSQLALVQKGAMDENCTTMQPHYSESQWSQRKTESLE